MDTRLDEREAAGAEAPTEPGPRLARTLAEQERRRTRRRRAIGAVAVVGVLAVGAGAWALTRDDGGGGPEVGTLIGSEKGGATTKATGGASGGGTTAGPAAKAQWPSALAGRPPGLGKQGEPPGPADGVEDGFYLWQDFNGWHLWVVGGTAEDRVTVTSDDQVAKAQGTTDGVAIDQAVNTFTFSRGSAGDRVVGVDFNPGYYAKTMIVSTEGGLRVHVGARRWGVPKLYGIQFSTGST